MQEFLLLLLLIAALVGGVAMVYRSDRHTREEKAYWLFLILLFNMIGLSAFVFEYFFFKKKRNKGHARPLS